MTWADPYYAMPFIQGNSFAAAIDDFHARDHARDVNGQGGANTPSGWSNPSERVLAFRRLLGQFVDVCNAIGYAHSRGVVHRDIKPTNVMLGEHGETFVVDWGLAKRTESDTASQLVAPVQITEEQDQATRLGTVVGTVGFMSPEQAQGGQADVTASMDIYSLGATLYYLLAGEVSIAADGNDGADGQQAALRRIESGDFSPPRNINPRVPAPLNAVCIRAMSTQASGRYPSATELGREVERWLGDESVHAYQDRWPTRFARWCRRHRTAVTATAVLAASLLVALAVGNYLLGRGLCECASSPGGDGNQEQNGGGKP